MIILESFLLNQFKEIKFGFSTKIGLERKAPFYFNLSHSVGDEKKIVDENRSAFFNSFGLNFSSVAVQKQVHGDEIRYVEKGGIQGESDAMFTDKSGIGLAISSADCSSVFIFDRKNKIIAGIHSGWRSTEKEIVRKTVQLLIKDKNCNPHNMFVYISTSMTQKNYEVGPEVAEKFDNKYLIKKGDKYLLDVSGRNYDLLLECGIPKYQIQKSNLCTFENNYLLHSYRKDGKISGRAFGLIMLK